MIDSIVAHLKTVSSITALVSDRIYSGETPVQISKTCIVVTKVDGDLVHNLDVKRPVYQVSVFSKDHGACVQLADLIVAQLKNYSGSWSGTYVVCTYRDDRVLRENTWWHAPTRFQIKYQED